MQEIELAANNILLRPYQTIDIEPLYEAARSSIKEVFTWLPWCHPDYSIEESGIWIASQIEAWKNDLEYNFCIIDAGTGEFLGGCGLNQINKIHNFVNLGYWVKTGKVNMGIASHAARLSAEFALKELNFSRIEIITAVGNIASQRVAVKIGAKKEGIFRNRLLLHGKSVDAICYSIIPEDFF